MALYSYSQHVKSEYYPHHVLFLVLLLAPSHCVIPQSHGVMAAGDAVALAASLTAVAVATWP